MSFQQPPSSFGALPEGGRRGPSTAVMWANAALFWSALPALYLLYLTIRNIAWAKANNQPWLKYAAPLATVVGVVVVGLALLSQVPTQNPYGTNGLYRP